MNELTTTPDRHYYVSPWTIILFIGLSLILIGRLKGISEQIFSNSVLLYIGIKLEIPVIFKALIFYTFILLLRLLIYWLLLKWWLKVARKLFIKQAYEKLYAYCYSITFFLALVMLFIPVGILNERWLTGGLTNHLEVLPLKIHEKEKLETYIASWAKWMINQCAQLEKQRAQLEKIEY